MHCAAPFPLLSDQGGKVAQAYGVDTPLLHFFRRTTFLIDEVGILRDVIPGMPDNKVILAKLRSWPPIATSSTEVTEPDVPNH